MSSNSVGSPYCFDEGKLSLVRKQKLWMNDPKYFKRVKVSPSAAIKMIMHGQQGVEKGVKQSGKPVEVMGLLLGRPDTEDLNSIIVTDALALPIEGFETKVIADDENVINYMIELGDALEITRKERFCGWYHTHPFDIDNHSHCFLSNTDISTQLQWQRSEDPHGNPWLAIVIDPLYSLHKQKPEMRAFRVYPPEYNPPSDETPDGSVVTNDKSRIEIWGACWNRYYSLEISYFISDLSRTTLGILKNKFLWHNSLCVDDRKTSSRDVSRLACKLESMDPARGGYGSGAADAVLAARKYSGGVAGSYSSLLPAPKDGSITAILDTDAAKGVKPLQLAANIGTVAAQRLVQQQVKLNMFGPDEHK